MAARRHCLSVLALVLCAGAAGCRHKPIARIFPLGPLAPVALEEPPTDEVDALTVATVPLPDIGPFPASPPVPPAPRRRPAAPKEDSQPATNPAEVAPAELAIGSLSTGANATPQIQQQAQDMISSIVKRIGTLSSRTAAAQRSDLNKVRNFLKQAQQALNTGDLDGAKNLATKAGVLMDDLEKR